MFAHDGFDLPCDPQVVRTGQAVADDRAFQRDDRLAGAKRSGDLRINPCQVRHLADATRRLTPGPERSSWQPKSPYG
jgi:hypothetical protein